MRLVGYCTKCHKFKYVQVTSQDLFQAQITGSNIVAGICDDCDKKK
jgi:hypothetical protein